MAKEVVVGNTSYLSASLVDFMIKVVSLPDLHFPNQISQVPIIEFVKDVKPDYLIFLGDALDLECVSHWIKEQGFIYKGESLKQIYDGFQKIILEPYRKASPKSKFIYLTGNHEDWIEDLIKRDPNLEGFVELRHNLDLKKYNMQIVPLNTPFQIGKLYFMHGIYTNIHHSKKTANNYNRNIIYGHCHDRQVYTMHSPIDVNDVRMAESIGCLCKKNPVFLENKPNKWIHAFGYTEIREKGLFNHYTITIFDSSFTYGGKLYRG